MKKRIVILVIGLSVVTFAVSTYYFTKASSVAKTNPPVIITPTFLAVTPTSAILDLTDLTQFMRPVGENDHIRGSKDALVKMVEYSDLECPFCKKFHPTMRQIFQEYGNDGRVAWIYRHFPLESHPKAKKEAEAAECAGEIGNHEMFWKYIERVFELTPSENRFDLNLLPQIARDIGLGKEMAAFQNCLDSGRFTERITMDIDNALIAGGRGNPYVVVIAPNGKKFNFSGAQPYGVVKNLVELALKEK